MNAFHFTTHTPLPLRDTNSKSAKPDKRLYENSPCEHTEKKRGSFIDQNKQMPLFKKLLFDLHAASTRELINDLKERGYLKGGHLALAIRL